MLFDFVAYEKDSRLFLLCPIHMIFLDQIENYDYHTILPSCAVAIFCKKIVVNIEQNTSLISIEIFFSRNAKPFFIFFNDNICDLGNKIDIYRNN